METSKENYQDLREQLDKDLLAKVNININIRILVSKSRLS